MSKHNYSQYSNKKNDNKVDTTPAINEVVENQNENVVATIENADNTDVTVTTLENKTITDDGVTVTTLENKTTTESNSGAVATGVVNNCAKLNVRSKPNVNGDVVTILNANDKVTIDVDKSTSDWFKICTVDGIKGYCMRKFVSANI